MKMNYHHKFLALSLLFFTSALQKTMAQDSVPSVTILDVHYFLPENKVPYLEINTRKKTGRKFEPEKGFPVKVYFSDVNEKNLLGKLITGTEGKARMAFPPSFKNTWDSLNEFKFIAVSDPIPGTESLTSEITIRKAVLEIDTTSIDGIKTVVAHLKEKNDTGWTAVKEIEMKLAVKRGLGYLTVGEAETYTSDSIGVASAEFKRDSIPGDDKGYIILVAKVEDNDNYGNLVTEKQVRWGEPVKAKSNFWRRTLWSTGNRAPVWLLCIAFSIIIGVWSTLFYLIVQVLKIKKLGKNINPV